MDEHEAREKLTAILNGFVTTDSIGAAHDWLRSDDAEELLEAAGYSAQTFPQRVMKDLLGLSW